MQAYTCTPPCCAVLHPLLASTNLHCPNTNSPWGSHKGTRGVHKCARGSRLARRAGLVVVVANGAVGALHIACVGGLGATRAVQARGGAKGGAILVNGAQLAGVGIRGVQLSACLVQEGAGAAAQVRPRSIAWGRDGDGRGWVGDVVGQHTWLGSHMQVRTAGCDTHSKEHGLGGTLSKLSHAYVVARLYSTSRHAARLTTGCKPSWRKDQPRSQPGSLCKWRCKAQWRAGGQAGQSKQLYVQ
jgi:hypothetical protein